MWIYEQSSGILRRNGVVEGAGYSGAPEGRNDPSKQNIAFVGPIPCGVYRIGDPQDTTLHGPFVLPLKPDAANQMFGRYAFLIHGDSVKMPGSASQGCVILPRSVRQRIAASGDREFHVVARYIDETAHDV
jgi:hypothetical protein